jgi:hypothetical protein
MGIGRRPRAAGDRFRQLNAAHAGAAHERIALRAAQLALAGPASGAVVSGHQAQAGGGLHDQGCRGRSGPAGSRAAGGAAGAARWLSVLPAGATPTTRENLLERAHNKWIKTFIGEIHNRQGNHRLRAHVASYLADKHGPNVAAAYLRHSDVGGGAQTAKAHYIAKQFASLPTVTDADLLAWANGEKEEDGENESEGNEE